MRERSGPGLSGPHQPERNVWYAAVRNEITGGTSNGPGDYERDATGGYTFAAVFLTTRQGGGWGYKDMDETMGLNEGQAPLKLLDMLSPTTSEWCRNGEKCRDDAALMSRPLKPR